MFITHEDLEKIKSLFGLGLSDTKIHNLVSKGKLKSITQWVLRDSCTMYNTLLERTGGDYKIPSYNSLNDLHDLLVRDINQIEDEDAKKIALPQTNLEEYHSPGYSVKIADTAHTLNVLGRSLNICVGSYRSVVLRGDCVIAYVTQGDELVACLEVSPRSSALVQAKLSRNEPVSSDADVERVVYLWAKANRLASKTCDVGFKHDPKDLRRVKVEKNLNTLEDLPSHLSL